MFLLQRASQHPTLRSRFILCPPGYLPFHLFLVIPSAPSISAGRALASRSSSSDVWRRGRAALGKERTG
jgi:hypothetical protein